MNPKMIDKVRDKNPLVHHLINYVVMNFVANGVISFGGSPVMAMEEKEAQDIAKSADAVLLNVGTLSHENISSMIIAGQTANKLDNPVVLDPVGVAATSYRSQVIKHMLKKIRPTVIKGNAGEIAHLVDIPWKVKGVDSVGEGNIEEVAVKAAQKYNTNIVITGETDIICTGKKIIQNTTGHPYLAKITGGGCLLGSIIACCLTTDDHIEDQLISAVTFYGLAAEYAASQNAVTGPGTFKAHFIDALSFPIQKLKG
ncbi:hydroxyethylthiazole kinase [Cerasibacillus quisquiliarum]|uniref:Hydroxyethylthiazole kinase n=1 Tax=Cerasibacillus quisquiliarum TaxID=227865 RepID=A0A511V118_9BACI|nr:hydroxyethylthiazole kinase [Cerasibacillus quisquiliarum]MBB5146887.1 hydroxyethylthiazole kinase [Cerasibacillus quisquiliarum]GEN31618.1 hydroxyethylthiazole kinase [Cerasibacillus quisquiliarum]